MNNDGVVFLGMPGYGRQTAAAGRAFWRASQRMEAVYAQYENGSLLAQNFNALWCSALNLAEKGEPIKYFAMLHDDCAPEDFWLDKLLAELEEQELDVLSVVSPIKDTRGITSTALHKDGENWLPLCRLTMKEVYRLPPTFTSADVGAPLLLNTGCWVCRFDPAWNKQVWFTVNDRIGYNSATGSYVALTESEDWFFSRLCHELGLRLGVTRKIKLHHRGEIDFANSIPYGTHEIDRSAVSKSQVPEVDRDGFRFPQDVRGWLTYDEGKALWQLARGKRVLEIGSYCGKSTICLAQSASSVVACDYFDGRGTPKPGDTLVEFVNNVARYGVEENVQTADPDSIAFADDDYDLIFIDGTHDYESVRADVEKASHLLAPGGLLAFHDYRLYNGEADGRWDPGVTQAVNELFETGGELLSRHDSLAVVRPPAQIPCEV